MSARSSAARRPPLFWRLLGLAALGLPPAAAAAAPPAAAPGPSAVAAPRPLQDRSPAWLDLAPATEPASRAVQRRRFTMNHELDLQLGGLPTNPFYKGYTVSAGYTWHISDTLAWAVLSATYALDVDTNLKLELLTIATQTGVPVPVLPVIRGFLASHLVAKPLYGKQAFADLGLVHLEAFVQAGPALLMVQWQQSPESTPVSNIGPAPAPNTGGSTGTSTSTALRAGRRAPRRAGRAPARQLAAPAAGAPETVSGIAVGLDLGVGVRVWATDTVSVRAEVADLLYAGSGGAGQTLRLQLGVAFNFGGDL